MTLTLRFLGTGDAFGSGGRFQACILATAPEGSVLLDCGASSLIAMKRARVDPSSIDAVVVSHFHGDHFGGIPSLILDGQFAKRERELVIAGPHGVAARVRAAFDALYAGSAATPQRFGPRYVELEDGVATAVGPARVTALPVDHSPGTEAHGVRVELGDRVVGYSGDTAWTDSLVALAARTHAFVLECYSRDKDVPKHLSARTIATRHAQLATQRLILTHLGPEMLEVGHVAWATIAHDGLVVTLDGGPVVRR